MATRNAWLKNAHQKCMTDIHTKQWCKQMPANMLIQKLSQTWPQGVHSRKKYCLQVCPPKIATKMAQAWQAEIHDKKSQNNSLRQKAKKYILHKNVRTQNT